MFLTGLPITPTKKQSDHWVAPDRDGTLHTMYRVPGRWCPLCHVDLPTLEDYDLLGGWFPNTTVECYNCTVRFEIVNSDPLELTISKIPLQAGLMQRARNRHGDLDVEELRPISPKSTQCNGLVAVGMATW